MPNSEGRFLGIQVPKLPPSMSRAETEEALDEFVDIDLSPEQRIYEEIGKSLRIEAQLYETTRAGDVLGTNTDDGSQAGPDPKPLERSTGPCSVCGSPNIPCECPE